MADLSTLPTDLRPIIERALADMTGYTAALETGTLTVADWRRLMAEALARYHMAAVMVGMGSTELTPEIMALLNNTVEVQLAFLDNFARVVEAAGGEFNPAWIARAQMYALSPKSSWAEGDVIRQTGRVLPLPAMPAQGTQCGTNCLCRWQITRTGDNTYSASWQRHADDSCQTCIIRGQEWANLIIEDGVLLPDGVTTKHLGGKHDQQTHGFRFGATPTLDRARRMQREGTWNEYKRRSRQRSGTEPGKGRQDAKERQYQQAQRQIAAARKEYAGVKAKTDKVAAKEKKLYDEYRNAADNRDKLTKDYETIYAKENEVQDRINAIISRRDQLRAQLSYSDFEKNREVKRTAKDLDKAFNERDALRKKATTALEGAQKSRTRAEEKYQSWSKASLENKEATETAKKAADKYLADTERPRRIALERGREKAEAVRQEMIKHENEYNRQRNQLIDSRKRVMGELEGIDQNTPQYAKKAQELIDIDEGLRKQIGDPDGPMVAAQRMIKQDSARVNYDYSKEGDPQPFDEKVWEHGAEEFSAYVGRNPLIESARPEIGLMSRDSSHRDDGRAYAHSGNVYMGKGDRAAIVVHELGHVMEHHDPAILAESLRFIDRRTGKEQPRPLSEITKNAAYGKNEVSRPDRFLSAYIGKSYGRNASEVLSMGLQMFYEDPMRLARLDPDYFNFLFSVVRMGL